MPHSEGFRYTSFDRRLPLCLARWRAFAMPRSVEGFRYTSLSRGLPLARFSAINNRRRKLSYNVTVSGVYCNYLMTTLQV